jgi:hypothetical protein
MMKDNVTVIKWKSSSHFLSSSSFSGPVVLRVRRNLDQLLRRNAVAWRAST